ncbi:MAG: NAD(P)-binding protein, partial [Nonomuraea sp.]|nr:NAD(P)-binding protein [Nonomuraea sp.]
MKALICGAGISGLTLAWHLERAGWQVELVERGPAFRDGGYLVDFYGAGYDAAERMGLTARLATLHHRITELGYLDGQGRQVSRFALPPSFDRMVTVLRGDLARTIADRVAASIRDATTVESVDQHDEQVTVG